jgi:hypothetical protein
VKAWQRLESLIHERDFTFVVREERRSCPSFVAEFLSPRVTSLRSQDMAIDEWSIETEDPSHQFEALLSISFGRDVSFGHTETKFVRSVCGDMRNSELFEKTLKNEEGLKTRLKLLSWVHGSPDFDILLLASHFCEFRISDFDHLNI